MRYCGVALGAWFVSMSAFGAVWYVDVDSPTVPIGQDGTTWTKAFDSIQEGVDAAFFDSGGEVWVGEGVYTSSGEYVVVMRENVHIYGGFAGNDAEGLETARGQRDWEAHATVLDGEGGRSCAQGADNSTIDGFTLKNGKGIPVPMSPLSRGGAVLNIGVSNTVANCLLVGNTARSGCAIASEDSGGLITNCVFLANSGWYGGAALSISGSSSPVVTNCVFTGNVTLYQESAVSVGSSAPATFHNCVFVGNTSATGGLEAMGIYFGSPVVTNCLFAGSRGPAIGNANASPVIVNCTFDRNVSGASAGAIVNSSATPTLTNCILWNSVPAEIYNDAESSTTVTYSDVQGGYSGEGNFNPSRNPHFLAGPSGTSSALSFDPQTFKTTLKHAEPIVGSPPNALVGDILWVTGSSGDTAYVICDSDAEGVVVWGDVTEGGAVVSPVDYAVVDYRLAADSPCLDAGRNTSAAEYGGVRRDILGRWRGLDGAVDGPTGPPPPGDGSDYDMGAYEMAYGFDPADVDCSGEVDAIDVQLVINEALEIATGYNCDVDRSGSVDAIDVQLVINAVLGVLLGV